MKFENYTREELVAAYIEQFVFEAFEHDGGLRDGPLVPTDLPKTPEYWKNRNTNQHEMHKEIARRYHVKREDILWLDGIFNDWSGEMYVWKRRVKPLIKDAIRRLEALEDGRDFRAIKRLDSRWTDADGNPIEAK